MTAIGAGGPAPRPKPRGCWSFSVQMGLQDTDAVSKAVNYLLETGSESESWRDGSVVGTGHPGILYVEYPVYPKVFPVMALANYLNPR